MHHSVRNDIWFRYSSTCRYTFLLFIYTNHSAGKLPEGRFGGPSPPRNVSLLLLFASEADKKKQQKEVFEGLRPPLRLVGREHSPGVDRLPDATAHLGERAGVRGGDLVLHLHGLNDEQHLPGLDRLARHGAHRQDRALDCADDTIGRGWPGRRGHLAARLPAIAAGRPWRAVGAVLRHTYGEAPAV